MLEWIIKNAIIKVHNSNIIKIWYRLLREERRMIHVRYIKEQAKENIDFYGEKAQREKINEELIELMEAIESGDEDNIDDEMADVFFLLFQMFMKRGSMRDRVDYKVERQRGRRKDESKRSA